MDQENGMNNTQAGNGAQIVFHTGYHSGRSETYEEMRACLMKITNEQCVEGELAEDGLSNPYEEADASIFLQGSCQLFSLALHQEFGFAAFEIEYGTSSHNFCKSTYHGADVYIDVRGATTDFAEFLSGLYMPLDPNDSFRITPQNVEKDARLQGDYDEDGFRFAKQIIEEHPEFYNVNEP